MGRSASPGYRFGLLSACLICLWILLPILLVFRALFAGDPNGHWAHLVETGLAASYSLTSVYLVLGVGLISLALGTGTAWLTAAYQFPGSGVLRWAMVMPLTMPTYVLAYCWTDLLDPVGPVAGWLAGWGLSIPSIRSLGGAWILLGLALYPYVYLTCWATFRSQSTRLLEAARNLGCTARDGFFRVVLPSVRPVLVAGTTLVAMETLAEFGAVDHLSLDTFTTGIYRTWTGMYAYEAATRLAALLLLSVTLVVAAERLTRRRWRMTPGDASRFRGAHVVRLHGWHAAAATAACLTPVLLGFVVPCFHLLRLTLLGGRPMAGMNALWSATVHSAWLALGSGLLIIPLALWLCYVKRLWPSRPFGALLGAARMGYAIPGSVIAVAIIVPFSQLDNEVLSPAWLWLTGRAWRLPLTGSLLILFYTYLVRFFALGLAALDSRLERVPLRMDDAARSLGCRLRDVMFRVHLPLLGPSVLTASLLVMVEVLKELPATLIVRPFGVDTLATLLHQEVARETLTGAALPALVLALIGILPMMGVARYFLGEKASA